MDSISKIRFGNNDLILETGRIARQANGSVTVQYGGTVVLVTCCMSKEPKEDKDFFPLTVEYQEKTYAAGRIPGGFFKREGKPSENEILTARLIDRPIRPLFPKGIFNEVQIMAIVLSSDGENDPDVISVIGASAALSISDIPFNGPLGCCRVGRIKNNFILNPTYTELEDSDLDVVIAGTSKGVIMLEAKAKQVSEKVFLEAIRFGFEHLKDTIYLQRDFTQKYGKPKTTISLKTADSVLKERIKHLSLDKIKQIYKLSKKEEREEMLDLLYKELENTLSQEGFLPFDIKLALNELEKEEVRKKILEENIRIDGRGFDEIRPIECVVSVLPRTHGSSLFTRGSTQSLAVTTLGTGEDEQLIEALEGEKYKSFMLHYSFPPFSVGEIAPVRGPGRREIGHGALAERALLAVMPSKERFPYTVRVVSEILESNGSSSMATVCAASLSLMDAGVPIKDAVGGIALGLIKEDNRSVLLTDITGLEDHFGDMDFKVAGTKTGITALQLDLKIDGIDLDLLEQALLQAKQARAIVLEKMRQVLPHSRPELSIYAPRIESIKIKPEKIGDLIGPGGKTIKKIIASTGTTIDIREDGTVLIASTNPTKSEEAIKMIKAITEEIEVGDIYIGKIKRLAPYGAFCEIAPGKEGLIHISELADYFVRDIEDVVKVGDEVKVKVIGIDDLGRISLSKKQAEREK
ncbi:MAG: polyribonucleotide nucleotidyltransferase [Candidatus Omnitrophica bacterium]|nr:polyribonucleotide nucleotidyltransferase [Candidatus Omnitrophota bacterium]